MDLPAQQHHINVCLDGGSSVEPLPENCSTDAVPSHQPDSTKAWLESLGISQYQETFEKVELITKHLANTSSPMQNGWH